MQKSFEIINHTADMGIIAYGNNLAEAFANAAIATFSYIVDLDSIQDSLHRDVDISASDQESLLVEWLNELLYIFDVEHIVFNKFEIRKLTQIELQARCFGEKIDLSRHKLKAGIKAATYHMLKIDKDNSGYRARVIFDV